MADKTGIEWTDATWNPIRGCSRVSEGCRHCYAESEAYRFSGPGQPYEGLVRIGADGDRKPEWNGVIRFVEEHLLDPLKWKKPRRIFVNSMSDLFHPGVTDEMLDRIFAVMALCPQHTFQVLTKRPERMLAYFNRPDRENYSKVVTNPCARYVWKEATRIQAVARKPIPGPFHWTEFADVDTVAPWPLPNVWLGVSVEDQKAADARIPLLLQIPAAVRFVSAEPLLGPVDLGHLPSSDKNFQLNALTGTVFMPQVPYDNFDYESKLDWVIAGGESGKGARPMHPDWARGLRNQCVAAGVPFFFKQWGEWMLGSDFRESARIVLNDGRVVKIVEDELSQADRNRWNDLRAEMMAPVGKQAAGDLLDEVRWHQFPGGSLESAVLGGGEVEPDAAASDFEGVLEHGAGFGVEEGSAAPGGADDLLLQAEAELAARGGAAVGFEEGDVPTCRGVHEVHQDAAAGRVGHEVSLGEAEAKISTVPM